MNADPVRQPVFVEVTDTIGSAYTSGIQRHTRGVVNAWLEAEAEGLIEDLELVPVVWDQAGRRLRRLTPEERSRLSTHGHAEPAPPRPLPLPERWQPPVRRLANRPAVRRVRAEIRSLRSRLRGVDHTELLLPRLPEGAVLLELEAGWQSLVDRERHFSAARGEGARVVAVVADVMPILRPDWFPATLHAPFTAWTRAVIRHADPVVCISEATERDVRNVARRWGLDEPRTARTTLGADVPATQPGGTPPFARYLVDVATIEPRKDPATLLDAWDSIRADHPDLGLVFVGRPGWHMDEVVARIEGHPAYGDTLLWRRGADDDELVQLLRHATLAVQPSHYEGFGLPVIEALAQGCPVITTTGGALPEAGGPFAEYVEPGDRDALAALIRRHLEDPEHHLAIRARVGGFHPPTWRDCALSVAAACR